MSTTRKPILCFGEVLLRLTPPRGELILQSPEVRVTVAGAEANVAAALARFGHWVRMASVLPDTAPGHAALGELCRQGIDTGAVSHSSGRMGLFWLTEGAVRRPPEVLYDRTWSSFSLAPEVCNPQVEAASAAWFHVSGVTPALGRNCAQTAILATATARSCGVPVSFDGNYRSKLWEGWEDEAPDILRRIMANTTVLFGDDRDIALVLGRSFEGTGAEQRRHLAAEAAFEAFPQLERIACTIRHPRSVNVHDYGAVMFTRSGETRVGEVELAGIVDRVGTGDAFAAGVIHGLVKGLDDSQTLRFAHAAACLKHSVPGDFLGLDARAVEASMAGGGFDVRR